MKKKILLVMLLLSVSCFGNAQGMTFGCPKERPFLIREWENENCQDFNIDQLIEFRLFEHPYLREIPDYQYNPDKDSPNLLPELEKIREKISDMKKTQETIIKTIQEENLKIEEENQKVREKNKFFKIKREAIDEYYNKCKLTSGHHYAPEGNEGIDTIELWIFADGNLRSYLISAEHVISDNKMVIERTLKVNLHIRDTNIDTRFDNMKKEYKNNLIISEFEKFYTPEKKKQLVAEYEKAISENCVGCDYPKPLPLYEDYCNKKCPNREYMDEKCVLKTEILDQVQNWNKEKE